MNKFFTAFFVLQSIVCFSTKWNVGPSKTYTVPSAVRLLVADGDSVYIDGAVYTNDAVKWPKKNLKFFGLGTVMVPTVLQYTGDIPNGKGIWVFETAGTCDNPYIENITFDGAQVSDANGGNGAGIRMQAFNLTVKNCIFKNCQNGILEGGSYTGSNVTIENSEFFNNGYQGTNVTFLGYEHNIYISAQTDTLLVRNCHFRNPRGEANSLKTRAQRSYILYNFIDEGTGNGSWELNLAQGGLIVVVGNVIIQGNSGTNHGIISLDAATNPIEELYFTNNTIINKYSGSGTTRFMHMVPASGVTVYKFYNNIFASVPGATNIYFSGTVPSVIDTARNKMSGNYNTFGFVNAAAGNYNLSSSATAAINQGTLCGSTSTGYGLTPLSMYQSNTMALSPRSVMGPAIDIGAYEFSPTGIENFASGNNLSVSQDLNSNTAIFNINEPQFTGGEIKIYSIFGQLLSVNEFNGNTYSWNYNSVASGVYIAVIRSENKVFSGRVVVAK